MAVDAVLFSIDKKKLRVLLIKIKQGQYEDKWCVPGGLILAEETLEEAVKRILFQKTNVSGVYLEQLYTFGDLGRDSRSRAISVAYFALLNKPEGYNIGTTPYYADIEWKNVAELPELAFDHKKIIETAHQRLKAKIGYSNIVYSLLPTDFSLTQMQNVYEIILGEKLDKRNFRKKILGIELVEKSNKILSGQAYRPAQLYHFTQRRLTLF